MKIGIITFWTATDNYGQLLQCWALQQQLRKLGHEPFLIKYQPQAIRRGRYLIAWLMHHSLSEFLHKLVDIVRKHRLVNSGNIRSFDRFRADKIITYPRVYTSLSELRTNPPPAEAYICGSDQIWGLSDNPDTPGWFLNFGEPEVRKISYAASFGRDELSAEQYGRLSGLLKPFYRISVREKSGVDICAKAGFSNAIQVLDPSLLLDVHDYLKLCDPSPIGNCGDYLFAYVLNVVEPSEFAWLRVEEYLRKRRLDLKPVISSGYIAAKKKLFPNHIPLELTLPRWLATIQGAKGVITTSFHGVAMSVVMHRPFLVFLLNNKFSAGNNRISSLLNELGLNCRIYDPAIPFTEQMDAPIDWLAVESRLTALKIDSENYLIEALKP